MKKQSIFIAALIFAALALVACERFAQQAKYDVAQKGMFAAGAMPAPPPMAARAAAAPEGEAAESAPQAASTQAVSERKLMRRATLEIEVGNLEAAREKTQNVVSQMGGFIADTNSYEDNAGQKSLVFSLRVPAAKLDAAIAELKTLGRVKQERVGAEDVTEQYLDLEARLANAKKLEQRLLVLLESKASRLKDLLDTERELARVRTDIETMEGSKRYMDNRINLSTIDVTFSEPRGFGRGIFAPLSGTLQRALTTFTSSLASAVVVVSALIPWAVLVMFIVWLVVKIVRVRRRKKAAAMSKEKKEGQG